MKGPMPNYPKMSDSKIVEELGNLLLQQGKTDPRMISVITEELKIRGIDKNGRKLNKEKKTPTEFGKRKVLPFKMK